MSLVHILALPEGFGIGFHRDELLLATWGSDGDTPAFGLENI
jgi:hypothetical protein